MPRPTLSRSGGATGPAALRPFPPGRQETLQLQRRQAASQLAAQLGQPAAQELTQHLSPSLALRLGAGLDRVQHSPEGRQLKALLRQAVTVLSHSRQQAKTRPTQVAVARQLNQVGHVSVQLIEQGLQTRRELIRGSERGPLEHFVVETARSNLGFALLQGQDLAQIHVVHGERAASIRLTPQRVARSLDATGTREIVEENNAAGTFYYETEYTMRAGRAKPVHVTSFKSKVDPEGKIIPLVRTFIFHESGSPARSRTDTITRVKIEDRDIP